jgi:hypothetical protein
MALVNVSRYPQHSYATFILSLSRSRIDHKFGHFRNMLFQENALSFVAGLATARIASAAPSSVHRDRIRRDCIWGVSRPGREQRHSRLTCLSGRPPQRQHCMHPASNQITGYRARKVADGDPTDCGTAPGTRRRAVCDPSASCTVTTRLTAKG